MATVDEMEATRVTKEALQDLAKQLSSGRVNADILEDDIPEQPPEYQPDGRYPQMEFSDEEDSPEAPVGPDELRKATSVLDDVPMSVAQGVQSGRHSAPDRSTRRRVGPAPAEASSIRATVASSSADDPALRTVRQKRDFYEEAFKTTQEHLKKMKKKLEPQSTLIVKPVATSPEMEESEQSGEVEDALVTSESADTNVTSVDSPFIDVDLFALPSVTDDAGLQHEVPSQMFVTDMLLESVPLERPFDVLEARSRTPRGFSQVGIRRHPTPSTRAKVTSTKWRQLGDVPGRLRRPLTQAELVEAYHKGGFDDFHITRGPEGDYWLHSHFSESFGECIFNLDDACLSLAPFQMKITHRMLNHYLLEFADYMGFELRRWDTWRLPTPKTISWTTSTGRGGIRPWTLARQWRGVTRFLTLDPIPDHPVLATWMQGRAFVEELWRHGQNASRAFRGLPEVIADSSMTTNYVELALEVLATFEVFESNNPLVHPDPHPHWRGRQELAEDDPSHTSLVDIPKPPTGKIRLELQWSQLSPAWQQAFEDPIKDALDIYFKHDALTHVMPDEKILDEEVLPSRFVLVNKADPKNQHPEDSDLEEAKLKARLVIAGHKDQRAGDFETQAPTASLLSHNFLCFVAAQYKWRMFFADISAAFLQGDYLPEGRRVFIRSPKNYPMFVREFLMTKIPPGARTDLFRMKKAGFGLAESPRLWYQRFKRDIMSIGGRELALAPGVFSFCGPDGQIWALLAVHVDDVRLICSPRAEEDLWPSLKRLFTFGDWVHPKDFVKFCGRYEKQMEDFSVVIQMDEYGTKIKEPPVRAAGQTLEPLTPNERSWIGTIIGQVSWLARQVRGDLLFGCSRIQQLAGVGDASALQELKILVDRARVPRRQVFRHLGCDLETMVVLGVSDASFSGMPRGRSQGGSVLLVANPTILEGEARVNVLTFHSSLLKRVVRSSLAAEISQAATVMEEADFLRALMAEALDPAFQLRNWMASVAKWRQLAVLDSRTGYDLLNGTSLGEDKRLAIDVASMRQALQEDGAARAVRWVPGEEILADDLTKLIGNGRLMDVLEGGSWALKDTETAKQLRADAAVRKRAYRQRRNAR
ncbi:unnamed protein product [Durusdinium trenchii]|uniref:Reverse transcriptase Ty1/copia-type domain-containing protein n=1 Tax=Durusdinium trenchii TaxID=1381693 RepID=A0ABP0S605_9DINO